MVDAKPQEVLAIRDQKSEQERFFVHESDHPKEHWQQIVEKYWQQWGEPGLLKADLLTQQIASFLEEMSLADRQKFVKALIILLKENNRSVHINTLYSHQGARVNSNDVANLRSKVDAFLSLLQTETGKTVTTAYSRPGAPSGTGSSEIRINLNEESVEISRAHFELACLRLMEQEKQLLEHPEQRVEQEDVMENILRGFVAIDDPSLRNQFVQLLEQSKENGKKFIRVDDKMGRSPFFATLVREIFTYRSTQLNVPDHEVSFNSSYQGSTRLSSSRPFPTGSAFRKRSDCLSLPILKSNSDEVDFLLENQQDRDFWKNVSQRLRTAEKYIAPITEQEVADKLYTQVSLHNVNFLDVTERVGLLLQDKQVALPATVAEEKELMKFFEETGIGFLKKKNQKFFLSIWRDQPFSLEVWKKVVQTVQEKIRQDAKEEFSSEPQGESKELPSVLQDTLTEAEIMGRRVALLFHKRMIAESQKAEDRSAVDNLPLFFKMIREVFMDLSFLELGQRLSWQDYQSGYPEKLGEGDAEILLEDSFEFILRLINQGVLCVLENGESLLEETENDDDGNENLTPQEKFNTLKIYLSPNDIYCLTEEGLKIMRKFCQGFGKAFPTSEQLPDLSLPVAA